MIFDKDYPCTDKTHDFHCRYMSDGFCVPGYDDDRRCCECFSYLSCSSCVYVDSCHEKFNEDKKDCEVTFI